MRSPLPTKRKTLAERLCHRVVLPETPDGCWGWSGCMGAGGYATTSDLNNKNKRAHRLAYELFVGPIPKGLQLDHLCRNRGCVNPMHLEPVTNRENALRGVGPTAVNAVKQTCNLGHPFDGVRVQGWRECRICKQASNRRIRRRERLQMALGDAARAMIEENSRKTFTASLHGAYDALRAYDAAPSGKPV